MTTPGGLLPEPHVPLPRPRPWHWAGVALLLLLPRIDVWLPSWMAAPLTLFAGVAVVRLLFIGFRRLKERLFWRVRNRVAGSLVFIGVVPMVVLAGLLFLFGYLLLGQLAAHYVASSLEELARELSWLNVHIGARLDAAADSKRLETVVMETAARTDIGVRLLARGPDGTLAPRAVVDPEGTFGSLGLPPLDAWVGEGTLRFEGLARKDMRLVLVSLNPLPRSPGRYLEVVSPVGPAVWDRLKHWKSIEARPEDLMMLPPRPGGRPVVVDAPAFPGSNDSRWMVSWGTLLHARDYATGQREPAGIVVLRVPVAVLFREYLTVDPNQVRLVQILAYILLGLFAFVELLSAAVALTISHRITQSVNDLHQGTAALQEGDLRHRIPVRKNDQLGMLADSFNRMSGSIADLLEEVTEKKRLEHEIEIARRVQASLFPTRIPQPRGLAVFGGCEPARTVSGDYYDFVGDDETRLQIVVADIAGKGISAALLMANLQAAMRNQLAVRRSDGDPQAEIGTLVSSVNNHLFRNSPPEKYATLFVASYDAATRRLAYCNAGHLPPIALHQGKVARFDAGGTVVGLFETVTYEPATVELGADTTFVVYTDGVTEAVNEAGDEFGEDRLIDIVRAADGLGPEAVYHRVFDEIRRWQGDQKQQDDITLIVGRVA